MTSHAWMFNVQEAMGEVTENVQEAIGTENVSRFKNLKKWICVLIDILTDALVVVDNATGWSGNDPLLLGP